MKRVAFILICCLNIILASDFTKKYGYFENYTKALQLAKESKRDIVMVIIADHHCPWCEALKDEVLSLEYTNDLIRKNYIPLMVSSQRDNYPNKFNTYVTPAIHFISYKDESIIETVLGFNNNWRFYEIIEAK